VCWDETHFGKFANFYINRTVFFDVHPPLGKMLIGLFGYLDGYNASFPFIKPGDQYEDYRYLGMRMGCAIMGALIVPLSFLTVWEMTFSLQAASFSGLMILLDNGLVTLTRFILLDSPLIFFISLTVYTSVKFHNQRHRAFTFAWWFWLSALGSALSCTISVKFVGLFVVLLVGVRAIADLWDILGDMSHPVSYTVKHFLARAVCLIALPAFLYATIFYVHLRVLSLTGPGDGFYSSSYQTHIEGNPLHNATGPSAVAYGGVLRMKNSIIAGTYLHSHHHLYPPGVGARHQQVTTYGFTDNNNLWLVKRESGPTSMATESGKLDWVRNGDLIRLEHKPTQRNLHSHRMPAPVTVRHFQVTGYGKNGSGDVNDVWRLHIPGARQGEVLQTLRHEFQLVHNRVGCLLTTTKKHLPKWGFDQDEITCNPNLRDERGVWNVELVVDPRQSNVSYSNFGLSFPQRFFEAHKVMVVSNAGMKPKETEITSRPWMWPIIYKGQGFSSDPVTQNFIYLLGNPVIWWGNILWMVVFLMVWIVKETRTQRGIVPSETQLALEKRLVHACGWLFIGWLLHYVPFWAMTRILYFHHYFPALIFSSMLSGVVVDYLVVSVRSLLSDGLIDSVHMALVGAIVAGLAHSFHLFAPLTYGWSPQTHHGNSTLGGLKWMSSWEF